MPSSGSSLGAQDPCPCGTGAAFAACCGVFLAGPSGEAPAPAAPTAEKLMRSRYSAYVTGAIDYIVATHDEQTRDQIDVEASTAWSRETLWQGLEILATEEGGEGDRAGIVEFVARGVTRGQPFAQRERSRFRKVDGRWYYVDGVVKAAPAKKAKEPGPNEPCHCGSGKKYKRCHGAA